MESFPRWHLEFARFEPSGQHCELVFRCDRIEVGRKAAGVDIALDSPNVSRRHCTLLVDEHGQVLVIDNRSTNGTYVNGRRLVSRLQHPLRVGDRVRCGDWQLVLTRPAETVASVMARSAEIETALH